MPRDAPVALAWAQGSRAGAVLCWCVGGFCFALLIAAVAPMALGLRSYTVRSGSMTPAIRAGDIVIEQPISPSEAQVGDIVTFKDPGGSGRLITHRARAISHARDRLDFVTRGDANTRSSTGACRLMAGSGASRIAFRRSAIHSPGSGPALGGWR